MFPSKRKIYAGLAGIGITLGAAGLASAASSTSTTTAAVTAASATAATTPTDPTTAASTATPATATPGKGGDHADKAPTYTSSVTIAVPTDGTKPTDAALQAVATVTADQATAAAVANTPGTATQTQLKSIAGNVVWEVDVTATAGGNYDVVIDAGNATVLDTHIEGGHGGGHGDHADKAPTYTSSVTIAVPTDGTKPTDAALQAVATVTADQATAAAVANTPGTATQTQLKSIAGNVVWEVDVTATAGGNYDVVIDAGNATVLDTHIEGGHGGGHHGGGHDTTDATADAGTTATTTG